ncbi:hypothetical protein ACLOJK_000520 [Asimina triloba]
MADYGAAAVAATLPHTRDCYTSEDDEDDNGNCRTTEPAEGQQMTTKTVPFAPSPGESAKKPRGRPPGSKNKPKPPIVITRDSDSAMRPTVLQLSAGIDVVETVSAFARSRQLSICVLSGTGSVANVTIRHPTCHASTLTLHGRFDILSLSGGILYGSHPSSSSSSSSTTKAPSFTISIAGAQGQVIGGTVAGALIAAGPVVLFVASFANPSYHRLPSEEEEAEEGSAKKGAACGNDSGNSSSSGSGMSMSIYSVAAPSPLNCQISSEVLPWAPSARPPHHY